jgi:Holliday junction resolvase
MKTPESYEKDDVCRYLDSIGAWYFRPYMAGYGKSGVPDIVACVYGVFWALEIKREGKEPTVIQARRIKEIQNSGGQATWGTATKIIAEIKVWLTYRASRSVRSG